MNHNNEILFDAGLFVGALLRADDLEDWKVFQPEGLVISGSASIISKIKSKTK
jgi:hypothetical protein